MRLVDYIQEVLEILENQGCPAIPLDSSMSEPREPGLYYTARWERVFLCSADHEHGLLRFELIAVDSCLSDAMAVAENARQALSAGLGMRLSECSATSLGEGERAVVRLTARCFF
ncbi:MAG: hypothetical protein ABIM88_07325 [candidate division WOR-3 bacterium]